MGREGPAEPLLRQVQVRLGHPYGQNTQNTRIRHRRPPARGRVPIPPADASPPSVCKSVAARFPDQIEKKHVSDAVSSTPPKSQNGELKMRKFQAMPSLTPPPPAFLSRGIFPPHPISLYAVARRVLTGTEEYPLGNNSCKFFFAKLLRDLWFGAALF